HVDVEQADLGPVSRHELDGLGRALADTDDLEAAGGDNSAPQIARARVVGGDHDARPVGHARGTATRTIVPRRRGPGASVNLPPSRFTRSCIDRIPKPERSPS